jgi:lipopolysaccharide transport system ATP-binding protein
MSDIAIRVDNLGKSYLVGHNAARAEPYTALRDVIARNVRDLARKTRDMIHGRPIVQGDEIEEFWAVRDVSFEVKQGETLGIIGRNGAGKSTLLKILSRITEPTQGRVTINGRVASLLEVGTGFHPELSGRENIYLNGAILGMTRGDIKRRFDEIVAFAEIEHFLDTPVKRYSSGMYVRLAFAVAAHLEPEILVVDEVLAVGDIAFQKKCLGKMQDISGREGRTVLFVSHNLSAVRELCTRGILLGDGRMLHDGPVTETVLRYQDSIRQQQFDAKSSINDDQLRRGSGDVRFCNIELLDADNQKRDRFELGEPVHFRLSYEVFRKVPRLCLSLALRSGRTGEALGSTLHVISNTELLTGQVGHQVLTLNTHQLRPGEYPLYFWLGANRHNPYDVVDGLVGPLWLYTTKSFDELGFDPVDWSGYFTFSSELG